MSQVKNPLFPNMDLPTILSIVEILTMWYCAMYFSWAIDSIMAILMKFNLLGWQLILGIPKENPLVVFLHIPSFSQVVEYNPGRDINKESVVNRAAALYQILEGYQVHLISGHVHWNENNVDGNIFEHNTGAISGAWWSGDICYDGTPKGYGYTGLMQVTFPGNIKASERELIFS